MNKSEVKLTVIFDEDSIQYKSELKNSLRSIPGVYAEDNQDRQGRVLKAILPEPWYLIIKDSATIVGGVSGALYLTKEILGVIQRFKNKAPGLKILIDNQDLDEILLDAAIKEALRKGSATE